MTLKVGDKVPNATLIHQTGDTVHQIELAEFVAGKRVVLFGLPGAYTGTCSTVHLPSFVRTADALRAKGIDAIACLSVNDVRVMAHWGKASGAEAAGIMMLADWDSEFTKAAGLAFSTPALGFKDRCTRCAMLIDDGIISVLQFEEGHGVCNLTAGETMLDVV
jgi:peroxiredoxin